MDESDPEWPRFPKLALLEQQSRVRSSCMPLSRRSAHHLCLQWVCKVLRYQKSDPLRTVSSGTRPSHNNMEVLATIVVLVHSVLNAILSVSSFLPMIIHDFEFPLYCDFGQLHQATCLKFMYFGIPCPIESDSCKAGVARRVVRIVLAHWSPTLSEPARRVGRLSWTFLTANDQPRRRPLGWTRSTNTDDIKPRLRRTFAQDRSFGLFLGNAKI